MPQQITPKDLTAIRGAGLLTVRKNVTADGLALTLPLKIGGIFIHCESGTVAWSMMGSRTGSERVYLTADGYGYSVDVARAAGETIVTLYPPGEAAVNFSIVAW